MHDTTIERNVIFRTGGMGTGIAIKGRNHVLNNFIIDPTGFFQPRGLIALEGVPVDCRFAPGSPASALGIEPVDLRRVGLRR